jgi:hypothetical protein
LGYTDAVVLQNLGNSLPIDTASFSGRVYIFSNNAVRSSLHERNGNGHICFWLDTVGVFKENVVNLIVFNASLFPLEL